jgi:hypothetical protein
MPENYASKSALAREGSLPVDSERFGLAPGPLRSLQGDRGRRKGGRSLIPSVGLTSPGQSIIFFLSIQRGERKKSREERRKERGCDPTDENFCKCGR